MKEKRKEHGEHWNWSKQAQAELELKKKTFQAAVRNDFRSCVPVLMQDI
jgi:hypothetical protein